jgi:HemY protein
MADDPETRLLGLRGLYLEAERHGEREAARHYADEATKIAPQLGWAADATLEAKADEGDWQGALALLDKQKPSSKEERAALARKRAVLLTAQAMAQLNMNPAAAKTAALEAHRLQPDFVPAAVTAARALFRQDDLRRGAKVLEAVWAKSPHPEVADIYVHARPGDSTHDRLTRAKKLRRLKPNNAESVLAVARAALDAGEYGEAREAAEAAVRLDPREGAFLLLADIEEAERGDQGRVRYWLAKAVRAPRDPAWVADGYVAERWAPASPVTGRLDAFEWRAPMERLGQIIEGEEALRALPPLETGVRLPKRKKQMMSSYRPKPSLSSRWQRKASPKKRRRPCQVTTARKNLLPMRSRRKKTSARLFLMIQA